MGRIETRVDAVSELNVAFRIRFIESPSLASPEAFFHGEIFRLLRPVVTDSPITDDPHSMQLWGVQRGGSSAIKRRPLSVSTSLSNSHFQVAERALYSWNKDHHWRRNGSSHWNQAVKNLTEIVLKVLYDTNPEFFEECLCKFQKDQLNAEDNKKKNGETWRQLEEIVASMAK
ncbi:hypothetical protein Rs2_11335 [Raphanus sativus]|nr:hypothetical protein Rs2_11335 [Raphanus sativus]